MTMLRVYHTTVVTAEVPDEIALTYTISGCPQRCKGCHSAHLRESIGEFLTPEKLAADLKKYGPYVSCVLFLGGDWQEEALLAQLVTIRAHGLKTCLYSGRAQISETLRQHLDFYKVGPFVESRGGLATPGTNQKFFKVTPVGDTDMTYRFQVANRAA